MELSLFIPPDGEDEFSPEEEMLDLDELEASIEGTAAPAVKPAKMLMDTDEKEGWVSKAQAYDCKIGTIREDGQAIAKNLAAIVPRAHRGHLAFRTLVDHTEANAVCPSPAKYHICVIGRTGAGKSLLLNCVLGKEKVARSEARGSACTQVPTQYEDEFAGQKLPYAIRVQCCTREQITAKLQKILQDWVARHLAQLGEDRERSHTGHNADTKPVCGDQNDEELNEARVKAAQLAESGLTTLRHVLCGRKEFATDEAAKEYLNQENGGQAAKLAQLLQWCLDLLPRDNTFHHESGGAVAYFEAEDEDGLSQQLEFYATSDATHRKASIWPLIDLVRVGIRAVPILKYVIFTDWPGLGDTNDLRGTAAAMRMSHCDEIWTVSPVDRIGDEEMLWRSLSRYVGIKPCTIIGTHIDVNLNDFNEVTKVEQCDPHLDTSKLRELCELPSRVSVSHAKLQSVQRILEIGYRERDQKRISLTAQTRKQYEAREVGLRQEILHLEQKRDTLEQERLQIYVDLRNDFFWRCVIQKQLDQRFPEHCDKINFFPVSSLHYMGLKGAMEIQGSALSLSGTGIPRLRSHILDAISPRIVLSVKQYIYGPVSLAVHGTSLVMRVEEVTKCQKVLSAVGNTDERLRRATQEYIRAAEEIITKHFYTLIEQNYPGLIAHAISVLNRKASWHASSLMAFMRNDGIHGTKKHPFHSWDDEFSRPAVLLVLENWNKYIDEEREASQRMWNLAAEHICALTKQSRNRAAPLQLKESKHDFAQFMETVLTIVEQRRTNAIGEFARQQEAIKIDATRSMDNVSKGYFNYSYEDTYKECRDQQGRGYKKRVLDIHRQKLQAKRPASPFTMYAMSVRLAEEGAVAKQAAAADGASHECLDSIRRWLEALFAHRASFQELVATRNGLSAEHARASRKLASLKDELAMLDRKYKQESSTGHLS